MPCEVVQLSEHIRLEFVSENITGLTQLHLHSNVGSLVSEVSPINRMTEAQADPAAAEQTADDIWTQGPILAAVNADAVYSDSKTYV